jgi:L-amino acid N-acyltransferase YncA
MEAIRLRGAMPADVPKICAIHHQETEDRVATLDVEPPTLADQMEWFHRHPSRHPVVVAEAAEGIIGWASFNQFSARPT